ncbi:hypothetical protein BGX27_005558 [Mortierella sp. AM989]|nr:hypothetical protein BGX27_005558 [Mortierella sp. AM989]
MDSTLSKTSERGISLGGLNIKNLIASEGIPYRELNKKLIQQAITLSVLSFQKEELSKVIDDEATPRYASVKVAAAAGALEGGSAMAPTSATATISSAQPATKSPKDLKQTNKNYTNTNASMNTNKSSIMSSWGGEAAIIESEREYDSEVDSDEGSDRSDGSTIMPSTSSFAGSSSDADQDSEEDEVMDEERKRSDRVEPTDLTSKHRWLKDCRNSNSSNRRGRSFEGLREN